MTLWFLAAACALCLTGTRLAAAAFAGAAVAAALGGGDAGVSAPAFWAAATAAGLVGSGVRVRRLALPAAGLAAAVLAAAAPNAATVLPAWTVAAAAAALSGAGAAPLLAAEVPFAAAVVWHVFTAGFSVWPPEGLGISVLLGLAAVLRVPAAAGSPETALVLARAQTALLLGLAMAGPPGFAEGVLFAAPAAFAAAGLLRPEAHRDALQEAALVASVLAAARLGSLAGGWLWGALAAGTLVHLTRVVGPRGTSWARAGRDVVRAGGLGSPLLPVVLAVGSAAVRRGGVVAPCTVVALLAGLSFRAGGTRALGGRTTRPVWMAAGLIGGALALGLWPGLAVRGPVEGGLPVWSLALVGAGAVAGARYARLLAPARPHRLPAPPLALDLPSIGLRVPALVPLAALALASAGVWLAGFLRGFL